MNQDREEKKIAELFDELKRQDQLHAPPFARLWARAVSQSERAVRRHVSLRLVAAVAMVLLVAGSLAILFRQPSGPSAPMERAEFAVTISGWRSPTDFLLAPVDEQLLRTVPRLDESLHEIQAITSYEN